MMRRRRSRLCCICGFLWLLGELCRARSCGMMTWMTSQRWTRSRILSVHIPWQHEFRCERSGWGHLVTHHFWKSSGWCSVWLKLFTLLHKKAPNEKKKSWTAWPDLQAPDVTTRFYKRRWDESSFVSKQLWPLFPKYIARGEQWMLTGDSFSLWNLVMSDPTSTINFLPMSQLRWWVLRLIIPGLTETKTPRVMHECMFPKSDCH